MSERVTAKMKPSRQKLWAIVSPSGIVKPRLATSRRIAVSQYALHYAKPTCVAMSAARLREVETDMRKRKWSVRPVWLTITPRAVTPAGCAAISQERG